MLESLIRINRSVRRAGAERYLLVMLISFAASVTFTRAYLNLTGFPQLGNGTLHFAHILWGGLLLYIACLIPLIFANRWVYPFSAILAGLGIGLFIDEVGKFITSSNDYFFPPAAPIIYSFFVIAVLLYMRIKRKKQADARALLYHAFDLMEEVLEHELDSDERIELVDTLNNVKMSSTDPEYQRLAEEMLHFIAAEQIVTITRRVYITDRLKASFQALSAKYLTEKSLYWFITCATGMLGLYILIYPVRFFLALYNIPSLIVVVQPYIDANLINAQSGMGVDWLTARVVLEALIGLILTASAILLLFRRIAQGLSIGYLGILLVLTTLDLLIFYFDQFSTIVFVLIQLIILLALLLYRNRYQMNTSR